MSGLYKCIGVMQPWCNACVLCNTNTRLTLLIRANNKNSKRSMTARSAILVQYANGTLRTAKLGFSPLQSRAHRLHEVIGTQQYGLVTERFGQDPFSAREKAWTFRPKAWTIRPKKIDVSAKKLDVSAKYIFNNNNNAFIFST